MAEQTGVIITLGNWITAQAAKAAAGWPSEVTIAVNLSPVQIRAPGAALGILGALREAGLDPHRLELEVTESLFLDDDANTARFIDELAGARRALRARRLRHRLFVARLHQQVPVPEDQGRPQLRLGPQHRPQERRDHPRGGRDGRDARHGHRRRGLETIDQVQAVRAAGCTLGQGYYFSRAVPDYLAAMLLSQERERTARTRLAG